jgi:hypothetical protein
MRSGNAEEDAKAREADHRRECVGVVDASALAAPRCNKACLVP